MVHKCKLINVIISLLFYYRMPTVLNALRFFLGKTSKVMDQVWSLRVLLMKFEWHKPNRWVYVSTGKRWLRQKQDWLGLNYKDVIAVQAR